MNNFFKLKVFFFKSKCSSNTIETVSWNHKCLVFIFRIFESTVSYADGLSNDVVFIVPVLINDVNLFWMALSTYRSEMSNIRFKCLLRFSLFSSDISQRCNVETSETNKSINSVTLKSLSIGKLYRQNNSQNLQPLKSYNIPETNNSLNSFRSKRKTSQHAHEGGGC